MELLDEGVEVWRPVEAEVLDDGFRVLGPVPDTEHWRFEPGSLVQVTKKRLSEGEQWVAVENGDEAPSPGVSRH